MMTIGTEHEYSINNLQFQALPVSDKILETVCGEIKSFTPYGEVIIGKELQKTVIEFMPGKPTEDLASLEQQLVTGMNKFYKQFGCQYQLLGLGMHPTLRLDGTSVWDHDEQGIYNAYDRLFNIKQHGWLNIQALQVNLSYSTTAELITNYNKIRSLLPYLIAVTAASPIVEGVLTGSMDTRLIYYPETQKEIPRICNGIIPEKLTKISEYHSLQNEVFADLRKRDAECLCAEWLNSSGLIIRFSRKCLEIKALDEQECIHSDMAVCAFVRALMRAPDLLVEDNQQALLKQMDIAIKSGTKEMKHELHQLYKEAWKYATDDERVYLPVIRNRIKYGSLAERMTSRYLQGDRIPSILQGMSDCLRENKSYGILED
jgi:hypothetical protein